MLGNKFGAIPFESLKISLAIIRKLWVWKETDLSLSKKHRMFFIVNETKFFMKPEFSVTQSSAVMHSHKRAIADVLSGKDIFSTVDPS